MSEILIKTNDTANNNSYTGKLGEVCLDTEAKTLRFHDGETKGGYIIAQQSIVAPTGSMIMYGGASAPLGWLLCDGSAVSRTTYSGLFTAISTTYGTGDGSTTFNLPDMRGVYPKGAGTTTRVAGVNANGSAYAATLGTYSTDKMQGHKHRWGYYGRNTLDESNQLVDGVSPSSYNNTLDTRVLDPIADGTNGTPRTGATTEPQNLGVNFIIKT